MFVGHTPLLPCQVGTGGMSYLLTWRGSKPGLKPVLFVSHTDVVPVEEKTPEASSWHCIACAFMAPHSSPAGPVLRTHIVPPTVK